MSQYTTQQAILGEIQSSDLIALTDDNNTGQLDSTVLNQIIANASGKIDEKCANLYGDQLPFAPVPASVASMALTIVCYRLYRRRLTPDEQNNFYGDYKNVLEFLDQVNQGDMHLNDIPFRDFPQVAYAGRSTTYGGQGSNFPATSL